MSTTDLPTAEEAEMTECDGEQVVTMVDVLQEQQEFEDDANAVLGASDDKNCTYPKGYIKRQAIYACLTCCAEAKTDPTKRAGVCLACSLSCHENHELVELYTKRNFCCDCGNPKFNSNPCQFLPNKPDMNENNSYNQNFSGLYCTCHRPYPDPESKFEDEMIQCIVCEDWLHASHLEATVPSNEVYAEMICKGCMQKNEFLYDYSNLAVNVDTEDDVVVNVTETTMNGSGCNGNVGKGDIMEDVDMTNSEPESKEVNVENKVENEKAAEQEKEKSSHDSESVQDTESELMDKASDETMDTEQIEKSQQIEKSADSNDNENKNVEDTKVATQSEDTMETNVTNTENKDLTDGQHELSNTDEKKEATTKFNETEEKKIVSDCNTITEKVNEDETNKDTLQKPDEEQSSNIEDTLIDKVDTVASCDNPENNSESVNSEKENCDSVAPPTQGTDDSITETDKDNEVTKDEKAEHNSIEPVKRDEDNTDKPGDTKTEEMEKEATESTTDMEPEQDKSKEDTIENGTEIKDDVLESIDKIINDTEDKSTEKDEKTVQSTNTKGITVDEKVSVNDDVNNDVEMENLGDSDVSNSVVMEMNTCLDEKTNDNKRKLDEITDAVSKKPKLEDTKKCIRPQDGIKKFKGAVFWPSNFRQKLCTCNECITMYKDLSVLFLIDLEDTVTAYETLGMEKTEGMAASQYEKGLEALSSLDRIQQINALTEYNRMKDKLLEYLKSFKDRNEIVREEDIKAFFAGIKPKGGPHNVYFCR